MGKEMKTILERGIEYEDRMRAAVASRFPSMDPVETINHYNQVIAMQRKRDYEAAVFIWDEIKRQAEGRG